MSTAPAAPVRYLKRRPVVGDLIATRGSEHPVRVVEIMRDDEDFRRLMYATETTVETRHNLGGLEVVNRAGLPNVFRSSEIVGVLPKARS